MMTNIDYKKMILSNEIAKCKGFVGAQMLESIEDEYTDLTETLNKVMANLNACIDLLKYQGE